MNDVSATTAGIHKTWKKIPLVIAFDNGLEHGAAVRAESSATRNLDQIRCRSCLGHDHERVFN